MNLDEKVYNELVQLVSEHKNELFNKIAADRTDYIKVVIENLYKEHNPSALLRTTDTNRIKKHQKIEYIYFYFSMTLNYHKIRIIRKKKDHCSLK